jgi:hypothetical protein
MGAPGEILVCEHGHEVFRLEDHMTLDYYEEMRPFFEQRKKEPCQFCGAKVKYSFVSYDGDISNCSDVEVLEFARIEMRAQTHMTMVNVWNFRVDTVPKENIIKD